jgi:hypothetical protein
MTITTASLLNLGYNDDGRGPYGFRALRKDLTWVLNLTVFALLALARLHH